MSPHRTPIEQMSLLDWTPPEPVVRFEDHQVRAATISGRIAHGVAQALKDVAARGVDRTAVAQRMATYLGERVAKSSLDAWASEARDDRVIALPALLALVHVTGDRRLLELLAEPMGWAVIERRHLPLIKMAAIRDRQDELRRQADALMRQARAGGGL